MLLKHSSPISALQFCKRMDVDGFSDFFYHFTDVSKCLFATVNTGMCFCCSPEVPLRIK